mmetsp:Transcript_37813/g.89790  ORF Transcript_37813/g.89790 Transcript_37813/m.89790 type:complete len:113 (-) Transcript_37813:138-476(-)
MTWTVHRSGAKREFESLCQSLAEAGLLQLLMHSCGTEKSEAFLLMAMKFVCCIAESEQQVAAMNRAGILDALIRLNHATQLESVRRSSGEAIASLVSLDADGMAIIRSLRLM